MKTPAMILAEAAGIAVERGSVSHPCKLCGQRQATKKADVKSDYDQLACPSSAYLCAACDWALAGKPPNALRMWSVAWRADRPIGQANPKCAIPTDTEHVQYFSRGDTRGLLDLLLDPPNAPWFAAVTTTGKVHTVPYARINAGPLYVVRFERANVELDGAGARMAVSHLIALSDMGQRIADTLNGVGHPATIKKDPVMWRYHTLALEPWHRSPRLDLLGWCLTKEGTEHARAILAR